MTMIQTEHVSGEPVYEASAKPGLIGRFRQSIRKWRFERDFVAVVSALAQLSDRRLALIGMHRDGLVDHVERLIDEAEANRRLEKEVLDIIEHDDQMLSPPDPAPARTAEVRRIG